MLQIAGPRILNPAAKLRSSLLGHIFLPRTCLCLFASTDNVQGFIQCSHEMFPR
jgi:hypothetical protein